MKPWQDYGRQREARVYKAASDYESRKDEEGDMDSRFVTKHKRLVENDCYKCSSKRNVLGNAHIQCVNPDAEMTGDEHGIKMGWFFYPLLFDPTWMTAKCKNYSPKSDVSGAVSNAVSQEKSA
jgi:hypothetical protein